MKVKKPVYVRICPKCKSLDIMAQTPGHSKNIVFGIPTLYKCKKCGFENYVFPEIDLNKVKKKC